MSLQFFTVRTIFSWSYDSECDALFIHRIDEYEYEDAPDKKTKVKKKRAKTTNNPGIISFIKGLQLIKI